MMDSIFKAPHFPTCRAAWNQPDRYVPTSLPDSIKLQYLVSIHYFEYASDFNFPGEAHDFWELVYVDKGEISIKAGERDLLLKSGEILFHPPLEFHSLRANGLTAPNLVVISFGCSSPAMRFFAGRVLRLKNAERELLAQAVREAQHTFSSPLGDPAVFQLEKQTDSPFGARQLIKLYLEQLLIWLFRSNREPAAATTPAATRNASITFSQIAAYLEAHVHESLTLDTICRDNLIGRSRLQKLFHEHLGGGVIDYFCALKINASKEEIRRGGKNFTEIAREFGFASVHYFSRRFKILTGMAPSEYVRSVKELSERARWED